MATETGPRGLFDGFETYRTPTEDDYRSLLTKGLVVPDANVLLNLYRYTARARRDLLAVLQGLGDCLWIPHQVLAEFWRNRDAALQDPASSPQSVVEQLTGIRATAESALGAWINRVALPKEDAQPLRDALEAGFSETVKKIEHLDLLEKTVKAHDTNTDDVLAALEPILSGRVGVPLNEESFGKAIAEGRRRVDAKEPPGYLDRDKGRSQLPEGPAGDYLVWVQILDRAKELRRDVLFITNDVKDAWWRSDRRGPRVELAKEFNEHTGCRLFMLRPDSLLLRAKEILQIDVLDASLREVETTTINLGFGDLEVETIELSQVPEWASRAAQESEWTPRVARMLLNRLDEEAPVQAIAMRVAAHQNGFVSRDEIYAIGLYGNDRQLKGFTRPIRRITEDLKRSGYLADGEPEIFTAEYEGDYQRATGFRIPAELVPVVFEAI